MLVAYILYSFVLFSNSFPQTLQATSCHGFDNQVFWKTGAFKVHSNYQKICAHTFIKWLFLHRKNGLVVQNFSTFPDSINFKKIIFLVFHSVLGYLEGVGTSSKRGKANDFCKIRCKKVFLQVFDKFISFFFNLLFNVFLFFLVLPS